MMVSIGDTGKDGTYFGLLNGWTALYLPNGWGTADNAVPKGMPAHGT